MKEEIKVSVIIPIYNVEMYLEQCLNSVISQSLKDIEIICVEDCSTDNSYNILVDLACSDSRIRIIKNEHNMGLSETRNNGIKAATGKYIFFLDSDDYIEFNVLENLYTLIDNKNLDVLFFGFNEHSLERGKINRYERKNIYPLICSGKEFFMDSLNSKIMITAACTAIYKRNFIIDKKLTFKKDILYEDVLFGFEVLMSADRVSGISETYYEYVRRKDSITLSDRNLQKKVVSNCFIINFIFNETKKITDFKLIQAISKYVNNICKRLYNDYKQIKFFDWSNISIYQAEYLLLRTISLGFYNGFFGYKLPFNVVQDIKKADSVVIYGAGKVGQGLLELLGEYDISVDGFAVTKKDCNDYVSGIKVYQLDEMKDKKKALILIAVASGTAKEMYENAKGLGFDNILDLSVYI